MEVDKKRVEKYLDEIAAEVLDIERGLEKADAEILPDPHLLKSFKYSTIVIAEAMAGVLQHILAKKHNVAVGGYKEVFDKSLAHRLVTKELLERLHPFISFRNMLVHQYWRVKDDVFLQNLRQGLSDFRQFAAEIRRGTDL